jgi:hypothetical protein
VAIDVLKSIFAKCKIVWCPFEVFGFDVMAVTTELYVAYTRSCKEMDHKYIHTFFNKQVLSINNYKILTMPNFDVIICYILKISVGRATAQAVSRRLPNAAARVRAQVMWDLWRTNWHWGKFSPSTSVSPANSHSTDCSTLIIYRPGLVH